MNRSFLNSLKQTLLKLDADELKLVIDEDVIEKAAKQITATPTLNEKPKSSVSKQSILDTFTALGLQTIKTTKEATSNFVDSFKKEDEEEKTIKDFSHDNNNPFLKVANKGTQAAPKEEVKKEAPEENSDIPNSTVDTNTK